MHATLAVGLPGGARRADHGDPLVVSVCRALRPMVRLNSAPVLLSATCRCVKQALSRRIDATDTPVIDFTRKLMASRKDAMSLAQVGSRDLMKVVAHKGCA